MAQTAPKNEVWVQNPELLARFLQDEYVSWLMRYIEFDDQEPIPEFHLEMSQDLKTEERVCYKAPRSYSKSSHAARGFPLWLACEYPNFVKRVNRGLPIPVLRPHNRLLVVGGGYDLAIENMAWVKEELELNEDLHLTYGNLKGDKWGEKLIHLSNGVKMRAVGSGARIRGYRPTIVICDDLDDDEEVLNSEIRAKKESWFDKVIINLLDKSGAQCFVIGTDLHPLSLLNHIYNKPTWKSRTFKAYEPDGTPLWPTKWPESKLEARRKEIGDIAFNSEFMNEPIISENPVFLKEWFNYYDPESVAFKGEMRKGLYIVTSIDPAISKKDDADYTAIVTKGATFDPIPKVYTLEVKRGHWSLRDTVREAFLTAEKWNQRETLVETTAYQEALGQELRAEEENRRTNIGVVEIKPDKDKERRAHAVSPMYQNGQQYIDSNDRMQQRMIDEMILFPTGDHDDMVDAAVMSDQRIKDWGGRSKKSDGPIIVRSTRGREKV